MPKTIEPTEENFDVMDEPVYRRIFNAIIPYIMNTPHNVNPMMLRTIMREAIEHTGEHDGTPAAEGPGNNLV